MKARFSGCRLLLAFVFGVATLLPVVQVAYAHGDRMADFHIEAQPLQRALLAFSEQAGVQIIVATDTVELPPCDELKGRMSARRAIEVILAGSGLEFHFSSKNTVTVRRPVPIIPQMNTAGAGAQKSAPPPQ